ncbi:putative reverse transcriptase domain-containing protein [Tanacetum coccineum]
MIARRSLSRCPRELLSVRRNALKLKLRLALWKGNPMFWQLGQSCMLCYAKLKVVGHTDASFQTDKDDFKSQSGYVFMLNGGAISSRSMKQDTIVDSTTEAEYIASLEIPVWKWEKITIDLITKLPKTPRQCDAIWVIVDHLTKSAIFLPIKEFMSSEALAELYLREVVARHGVSVFIVSDRDNIFTSRFWQRFQEDLGTRVHFSITYHIQSDGQSERTIQTLKDMLWAYAINFGGSWDKYLPLAEFLL